MAIWLKIVVSGPIPAGKTREKRQALRASWESFIKRSCERVLGDGVSVEFRVGPVVAFEAWANTAYRVNVEETHAKVAQAVQNGNYLWQLS